MQPVPNWIDVLRYAWSVRFTLATVVFSAAGAAMLLVNGATFGHPVGWAIGVFVVNALGGICAVIARLFPQKALN